jgi:hypothetical protein
MAVVVAAVTGAMCNGTVLFDASHTNPGSYI